MLGKMSATGTCKGTGSDIFGRLFVLVVVWPYMHSAAMFGRVRDNFDRYR